MLTELSGANTKKQLWIVSELFYPETISTGYIMTEIAKDLTENYQVSVISGPEFYEEKSDVTHVEPLEGVEIHRIQSKGYDKNSFTSRILGHFKVTFKMLRHMKRKIPKEAEVLIVSNPVLLLVLTSFASKKRKWKTKVLVHDVFPENLVISGFLKSKKSILYKIFKPIFNNAFKRFETLILLGRDMKQIFVEKRGSDKGLTIIENWADTENIKVHPFKDQQINFLFAGNLGRLQGMEILLDALKETRKEDYSFTFVGSGALNDYIINFIAEHKLKHVEKKGWLPREEQDAFMSKATIGVVPLKKGMFGLGVPSKFYNLLAAGKPIFYIGDEDSEVHLVMKEHKIGWFAKSGSIESIASVLREIVNTPNSKIEEYSENARKLAVNEYNKKKILNKFSHLFEDEKNLI